MGKILVRRYICFFLIGISIFSQFVYSQTLATKIDTIIKQQLPHATIGVLVKDAITGQIIYSKNPDKLLSPASSIKLFTAAAALFQLKPTYRFLTTLSRKKQDYYISFSGSPSLTETDLTNLLLTLKEHNVKIIQGNIILDTSRFKAPFNQGGSSIDDLGWYYSAPDTAAILDGNAVAYDFISAKELGKLAQIKPKISSKGLTIINQVITVTKEQEKDHCSLNIEMKNNNTLRLYGCLAQNSKPILMQLAIPDPILWVRQVINKVLDKNNILLKGRIINGYAPPDAVILASSQSDNLIKLITHMLRESDNLYASSLTKELAYSFTKEGTNKQGAFAIKTILSKHTNLDMSQIEIADGVGTRYNLVTPKQIIILLTDLYHDQSMKKILLNALPQAGVSGTLKERMKNTALEKIVFAKTGTMHDISSLSGFVISADARPLIFSIIINGINKPISVAKTLEEEILLAIAEDSSKNETATPF
jgi:D-alanyl-D-alanine carboxypeptidase/D-alanyl-D-alanine-endopeptidase (penicillin-binding protein 4)